MEALHNGDTNHNGKIEVTELAAHVERRVPELFSELKANGWLIKGVPAAPVHGTGAPGGWWPYTFHRQTRSRACAGPLIRDQRAGWSWRVVQ